MFFSEKEKKKNYYLNKMTRAMKTTKMMVNKAFIALYRSLFMSNFKDIISARNIIRLIFIVEFSFFICLFCSLPFSSVSSNFSLSFSISSAVAVMGVDASLNMVFDLLEAGIFLGGMSFQVGGVSSTTRLEGVADDDVAAVAAADVTVCGA